MLSGASSVDPTSVAYLNPDCGFRSYSEAKKISCMGSSEVTGFRYATLVGSTNEPAGAITF